MKSYRQIEAVKVTVDVLAFLAEQRQAVSGQEIARALDMPHGTVMCHLVTLEQKRLVRSIGGCWELDMGMAVFWARYKSGLEGRISRAQAELQLLEV